MDFSAKNMKYSYMCSDGKFGSMSNLFLLGGCHAMHCRTVVNHSGLISARPQSTLYPTSNGNLTFTLIADMVFGPTFNPFLMQCRAVATHSGLISTFIIYPLPSSTIHVFLHSP